MTNLPPKKLIRTVELFVCRDCGKEFSEQYRASTCQRHHEEEAKKKGCPHSIVEYRLHVDYENTEYISKRCPKCGHDFEELSFRDLDFVHEEIYEIDELYPSESCTIIRDMYELIKRAKDKKWNRNEHG